MPKKDEIDGFWDIGDMLPRREEKPKQSSGMPRERIRAVEVNLGERPEEGMKIPPRREGKRTERVPLADYAPRDGFIRRVTVMPWPTEFGFYTKFRNDALRLFDRTHEKCDYVYFFSYMPQYDQLNAAQMAYYLYWRGEVRRGNYPKTDNSYLFLYIYEIINLPDLVPPQKGADILTGLWIAYRDSFRYLDKYLGEWLCDYCLMHGVTPDYSLLSGISKEAAEKVSLPEFYLRAGETTPLFLASLSTYDFRKSKYYAEHKSAFDEHITAAAAYAIEKCILPRLSDHGITEMCVTKDTFSGAVACHDVKCKITVSYYPLRHSYELRQTVTGIVKLCENELRAAFAVKSRFSPADVGADTAAAIKEYFDLHYPDRYLGRKKHEAEAEAEAEAAYMALYEPENKGTADIARALAIEHEAWETAALLDGDDIEEPMPAKQSPTEAMPMPLDTPVQDGEAYGEEDEPRGFLFAIGREGREALRAAAEGRFAAYCRELLKMPSKMKDDIDTLAAERLGDVVMDDGFSLLEDYKDEILTALAAFSEDKE